MSTQVTLKLKEVVNGETVLKNKSYEIEEMTFFQFSRLLKVLQRAFDELKKDGEMTEFIDSLLSEDINDAEEAIKDMDKDFLMKLMGAFDFLAVKLPERAIEIVSVVSGVPVDELENQKIEKVLEVYDTILEVNDIEAIIERLKKSFGATKKAMKFLQKRNESAQE